MTQPWSNQGIALIVIEANTGNFTGLFVYSPTPGPGNLIASIAAADGTDPFGNAYLIGNVGYEQVAGSFYATQVGQGVAFYDSSTFEGPWTEVGKITSGGPDLTFTSNRNVVPLVPFVSTAGTAANPSLITTDSWNAATLVNGWTGNLNYRLTAQGDLQISADLTAGTTTNGTTIFTFPAAYRPALKRRIPCAFDGAVASGGNPYFILNVDGTFTVHWVNSTQTLGGFEATVRLT